MIILSTKKKDLKKFFFKSRPTNPRSSELKKGKLSALFDVRNKSILNAQNQINQLAYDLANSVNAIHKKGFATRIDPQNNEQTTNINFFETPQKISHAARTLSVSKSILNDPSNVVTALDRNSPGDNRIALAISKLQTEKVMNNYEKSFEEHYLDQIAEIGLRTGKSSLQKEQSRGILAQAENLRERVAGVNLDEEATSMLRFQHAYEASAKVMQTANDMFDTIINIKR